MELEAAARSEQRNFHAIAPTGQGVENLRELGAQSVSTLNSFFWQVEHGRLALVAGTTLVVDEAGLLGAQDAKRLLDIGQKYQLNLVLMRDTDQLSPYTAGPITDMLERRIGSVHLEGNHRIARPELAKALTHCATPEHQRYSNDLRQSGVAALDEAGILQGVETRTKALDQVALAYVQDASDTKIALAHSGKDVKALNARIRALLDARDPKRAAALTIQDDVPDQTGSVADLRPGDEIELTERDNVRGLRIGERAIVTARDAASVDLQLRSKHQTRSVRVDIDDPTFRYRFTFARTVHGAKGRTVDSVHVYAAPSMSREVLTTAMGVHRNNLNVVLPTPDEDRITAMSRILQTTSRMAGTLDYCTDHSLASRHALAGRAKRLKSWRQTPAASERVLSSLLGRSPETLYQVQGVLAEAIGEVHGVRAMQGSANGQGASFDAVTKRAEQILAVVCDAPSWSQMRNVLPKSLPFDADKEAGAILGLVPETASAVPITLRVLSRAKRVAEYTGDLAVASHLRAAQDRFGLHANTLKKTVGVQEITPKTVDHLSIREPLPHGHFKDDIKPNTPRPRMSHGFKPHRALHWLNNPSDTMIVNAALNAVVGNTGPGFFETLTNERAAIKDQAQKASAELTLPNAAPAKGVEDMPQKHEHTRALTPATSDHQAVLAEMFKIKSYPSGDYEKSTALIASLGDAGTLADYDLSAAVTQFVTIAKAADSIGPVAKDVPKEWQSRLLNLVREPNSIKPPFIQSEEEWTWAMKHAYRIGSVYSSAEELTSGVPRQDWMQWSFEADVTANEQRRSLKTTKQLSDWSKRYSAYLVQKTNVDIFNQDASVEAFKSMGGEAIAEVVSNEEVAQDWKDRFLTRAKNWNTPTAHPAFESHEEYQWSKQTIYQHGTKALTGSLPQKNDLAKKLQEEVERTQTRSRAMKPF